MLKDEYMYIVWNEHCPKPNFYRDLNFIEKIQKGHISSKLICKDKICLLLIFISPVRRRIFHSFIFVCLTLIWNLLSSNYSVYHTRKGCTECLQSKDKVVASFHHPTVRPTAKMYGQWISREQSTVKGIVIKRFIILKCWISFLLYSVFCFVASRNMFP